MSEPTKCQLKQSSFLHQACRLERQDPDLMQQLSKSILMHITLPVWRRADFPEIRDSIPAILRKGTWTEVERKEVTVDYICEAYPLERQTHVYTDGLEEATRNGRGGTFIKLNDGGTIHHATLTGKYSTNHKAEAEALRTAASILTDNLKAIHTKMVIFSDAFSIIQALPNPRKKDRNDLAAALHTLQQSTEKTVIQWIPSHCNIPGNAEADRLAKEGGGGTATRKATSQL